MPSQDTWSAIADLQRSTCVGRIRTWVRTPNFGNLPKDELPVNQYNDWSPRTACSPRYYYYVQNSNGQIFWSLNGTYVTGNQIMSNIASMMYVVDSKWSARLSNGSQIKTLGKVSDAKTNLAVTFAEMSKTSDLILDTARRIDRAYRAFRRGNFGVVAKELNITPGRIHKNWLEYKYGWMPLLMDVKNSAEFLAQQNVGRSPRFSCKSTESQSGTEVEVINVNTYGADPPQYVPLTKTMKWTLSIKTKIWCELENPHLSAVQQLGLTNPALVAWELIPFSFVFDWFISVGDFLQAATALHGVTVRRAMISSLFTCDYTGTLPSTSWTDPGGVYTYHGSGLDSSAVFRQYGRYVWSPETAMIYPPKRKGLDFTRLITSLALIRGTYRGSGSSRI